MFREITVKISNSVFFSFIIIRKYTKFKIIVFKSIQKQKYILYSLKKYL